jgi:hypothetical protein
MTAAERERLARLDFIERVREYLRDYPELNTLNEFHEHSDSLIESAIETALEDFSATPPRIGGFLVYNFPHQSLLMDMVVVRLLISAVLLYSRNDINYQSGSMSVSLPQGQTYWQIAQNMKADYTNSMKELKASLNMERAVSAMGGVHSDYQTLHTHTSLGLFSNHYR